MSKIEEHKKIFYDENIYNDIEQIPQYVARDGYLNNMIQVEAEFDPSLYYTDPNEEIITKTYSKEEVELMEIEHQQSLNKLRTEHQQSLNKLRTENQHLLNKVKKENLEKEAENLRLQKKIIKLKKKLSEAKHKCQL